MATKPVILSVDDDPDVLRAIERDLRRNYNSTYRIVRATSASAALETLTQLKLRNEPVALIITDHRMPTTDGVEFLRQSINLYPDTKRVLLTAYADTDAAIRAINDVQIDYYMLKPWDPPQDKLYPVLDDLLNGWQDSYRPDFQGIRLIGHRWSPQSFELKDFLARNAVPYQWLDIELNTEACKLVELMGIDDSSLPILIMTDGSHMVQPSVLEVAEKIGLRTHAQMPFYDLIIVGSGPAGLAAAVYGASEGLRTLLIEREAPGGQAGTSSHIANYLGFPGGLSGAELAQRGLQQAKKFDVEIVSPQEVQKVRLEGNTKIITLGDGNEISCKVILVATGVSYRKLNVPGMADLYGAGVYYGAALTEGQSCADEDVYVVGGANSAGQAAVYFSRFARRVHMLVRADNLAKSMSDYLVREIANIENIEVRTCAEVVAVAGDGRLAAVTVADTNTGAQQTFPATSLFVFIGAQPRTDWLEGLVLRDKYGFVMTGPDIMREGKPPRGWPLERDPFLLETNVPGIFAAGDVRAGSVKRVASGVGEGSIAVQFVHRYLAEI